MTHDDMGRPSLAQDAYRLMGLSRRPRDLTHRSGSVALRPQMNALLTLAAVATGCSIEPGVEFKASASADISKTTAASADLCCSACTASPHCIHFVWHGAATGVQ